MSIPATFTLLFESSLNERRNKNAAAMQAFYRFCRSSRLGASCRISWLYPASQLLCLISSANGHAPKETRRFDHDGHAHMRFRCVQPVWLLLDDRLTVIAIAAVAYIVQDVFHEVTFRLFRTRS